MIKINLIAEGRKPVVARKGRGEAARGGGAGALSRTDAAFLGAIVLALIAGGVWYWMLAGELADVRGQVAEAQREVKELEPIIKEVEEYKQRKIELQRKIDVIEELKRNQRGPVRIMDQISIALPDLLWLDTLKVQDKSVELTGKAFNTNQVAAFLENLGKVPEFHEPELKTTIRQAGRSGQEIYTFVINFRFDIATPPAPEAAADAGVEG